MPGLNFRIAMPAILFSFYGARYMGLSRFHVVHLNILPDIKVLDMFLCFPRLSGNK